MTEFENEPVAGLPENLPAGEDIVWQGRPEAWVVFRRLLLAPFVMAYFLVLAVWSGAATLAAGMGAWSALVAGLWLSGLGLVAMAILGAVAWAVQRTTIYTVTNRRIVLRYGLALPMAVNIPFAQIEAAAVRKYTDGTGSISLQMTNNLGLAFIFMWPHVRPWSLWAPQPMLACLADVATASEKLARALAAMSAGAVAQRLQPLRGQVEQDWRSNRAPRPVGELGVHS